MAEDLVNAPWLKRLIVAAVLGGIFILAILVLQPFIVPVIWAVIIAYVTWPAFVRLRRMLRGRATLAATLLTIAVASAIVLPTAWLLALLQTEALRAYQSFSAMLARGPHLPAGLLDLPMLGDWLRDLLARAAKDPDAIGAEAQSALKTYSAQLTAILGGVGRNVVKFLIAILSLLFMYRDGEKLAAQVTLMLEQFLGERVRGYVAAVGDTVKAVVYGIILAALAQGVLAGIGYWAVGIEAAVFLAALTMICAMIPFTVPLFWGGASVWLMLTGRTTAAVAMFLWGALAVSWIDNVVRPLVISGATQIPFLLVMFGVLGGIAAFGLVGLFIGPVILAVVIAIWREWLAGKNAAQEAS
jgi:predicted PurR-regulated permease PerM